MRKFVNYSMHKYKGFFNTMDIVRREFRALRGRWYFNLAKWRGVKFLGACRFIGRPHFKMHPDTRIVIGNNCEFLSGHADNLIGINRPCLISAFNAGTEINIGENSGFSGTVVAAFSGITIGRSVKCGANTLITDSNWHEDDARSGSSKPIIIGDNVWLGVNTVVLKGVEIGANSMIGANSVVTKNIPPNVVAAGNPCRVIREISYP
jgi:acetyltransferase-like isoleucine patch superfamily enzyme